MKARIIFVAAVLTALVSALGPAAKASDTTYTFNLTGPNTAMAPSGDFAGDTIRVTGSGAFSTGGSVVAKGTFTHIKADGSVFARGTWQATSFTSFTPYGGPSNGLQGGELDITVTLFPVGGAPHTGIPMTVTCLVGTPPAGAEEGTTVDGFTEKTGGETLIHLAT